jgi:hypothetical protein
MRWAKAAFCTLALSSAAIPGLAAAAPARAPAGGPPLVLASQTPWVTPTAPWFTLALVVRDAAVPAADLHVSVTIYNRIDDFPQFQQAAGATPDKSVLLRVPDLPVSVTPAGDAASTCVTVLPDSSVTAPTPAAGSTGACPASGPTVLLGCEPDTAVCGDVYPVSVALLRKGSGTPVQRFTTFLTYQEPNGPAGTGGQLRVAVIAPVRGPQAAAVIGTLADHHDVPVTLDVSPGSLAALEGSGSRDDQHALVQLAALTTAPGGAAGVDQLLAEPYVPIDLAALSAAGLDGEIAAQLARGTQLLRAGGLHPASGPWVDTASALTTGNAGQLSNGLQQAGAHQLVLSDTDLATGGLGDITFAQPFTLALGRSHLMAAAASSALGARFGDDPGDPVLAAEQLLGGLSFVHFENTFKPDARGVVVAPSPSWQPQRAFMATLLDGLAGDPALSPVTLDQFFAQVPAGGNGEPSSRQLQSGAAGNGGFSAAVAQRILQSRQHLASFTGAVAGHPPLLASLSDSLLAAESQGLAPVVRQLALASFTRVFDRAVGSISLAAERTVTFTSRKAPIPITVLSSAPYPVTVVVSLDSDKFTFPDGSTRNLVLNRPTTPVRVQARARTSGDRLPVEVTLRTPNGVLTIARAQLTVHSTAISLVGIALTVLAGLTLLIWWARTWHRGRRRRPRAH